MMAFANNYVVSVLVNDKPQRELNVNGKRTIQIPFDSEYKLRLKNQTNSRALVNITIDGAPVFMGGKQLILESKQTIDLERFVADLDQGRKFKFVKKDKLASEGHFDPTSEELGKISVEFVPEIEMRLGLLHSPTLPWYYGQNQIAINNSKITCNSQNILHYGVNPCNEVFLNSSAECSLGGTVEGSKSDQKFKDSNRTYMWGYSKRTVIDIHMSGPSPKKELTKSEELAKKFYTEFGGNYDLAPEETQKALAFMVEKAILHTILNK